MVRSLARTHSLARPPGQGNKSSSYTSPNRFGVGGIFTCARRSTKFRYGESGTVCERDFWWWRWWRRRLFVMWAEHETSSRSQLAHFAFRSSAMCLCDESIYLLTQFWARYGCNIHTHTQTRARALCVYVCSPATSNLWRPDNTLQYTASRLGCGEHIKLSNIYSRTAAGAQQID